jgi:hypothetical protein
MGHIYPFYYTQTVPDGVKANACHHSASNTKRHQVSYTDQWQFDANIQVVASNVIGRFNTHRDMNWLCFVNYVQKVTGPYIGYLYANWIQIVTAPYTRYRHSKYV